MPQIIPALVSYGVQAATVSTLGAVGSGIAGAIAGGLVASMLQPTQKSEGPRLGDLQVQSSSYGTVIPFVLGSPRLAGQVIWASSKKEIATVTESGGKGGGGQEHTSYTYKIDLLLLLASNVQPGITRIWMNGGLIWNKSVTADAATIAASDAAPQWASVTIYNGNAAQLPDPIYEAAVGSANAPAYRGRLTVMLQDVDLGSSGQIPNFTFEIDNQMPVPSPGAAATVATGTFASLDSVALTSTKSLTGFRETGSLYVGPMIVNNPSGDSITAGSTYTSESSNSGVPRVDRLSDTKALFSWAQNTGSGLGYVAVLNVSGNVVSTVTPVNFDSGVGQPIAVALSALQAAVVYTAFGAMTARVLDISGGDVITVRAAFTTGLPTSGITNMSATKLTATSILVTWIAASTARGVVLTVSGTTFTAGSVFDISNNATTSMGVVTHSVVALTEATAMMVCGELGLNYLRAMTVNASGTGSTPYRVTDYVANYASLGKINGTFALCVYVRQSDGYLMGVVLGAAAGTPVVLVSAAVTYPSLAMITANKAICTYIDSASDIRSLVVNF